ncbi:hypothetical protein D3C75_921580 [compost metagenome]
MAAAARGLSPVSITPRTPNCANSAIACLASLRKVSRNASKPIGCPSSNTTTAVLPAVSSVSTWLRHSLLNWLSVNLPGALIRIVLPSTFPSTPIPARSRRPSASGNAAPFSAARLTIACANGWCEPASTVAAMASSCCSLRPAAGSTSVTVGLPSVSVPVLSNAMVCTWPNCSNAAPPLISAPRRVAAARPEVMAAGVEITKAHGQPISSKVRPR